MGLHVWTLGREAGIVDLHVGHLALGREVGREAGIVDLHVGHSGGGGGLEAGVMGLHVEHLGSRLG